MIQFPNSYWKKTWSHKDEVGNKLKGAILAAGKGKRMDPLTSNILPKPLFPLGGKVPMAEVWVRRFVESGIVDISMNLCVLLETIKRYFKDGSKFAANINYVEEDIPSGTLGGVCKQGLGRNAKRVISREKMTKIREFTGSTLIVPSGDVVTNFGSQLLEEMYEIHRKKGAAFSMVLIPIPSERKIEFGTAILENIEERNSMLSKVGIIKDFMEKDPNSPSNLSNGSIYMIEMDLLKTLDPLRTQASLDTPNPFYDFGKHVFPAMLGKLPYLNLPKDLTLLGIQYDGNWFDVGRKRDYLLVNELLLDGEINIALPYEKLPWGYLGANVSIDFSQVTLIPPVVIGNNCIIEPGVTLGPYAIIGDDWVIERGACIQHSVLWERYPYFTEEGYEIDINERKLVDRHEVRRNVKVDQCIVASGTIDKNIKEKTVDVLEDGNLSILSIDYIPDSPRA
ncbi:sugar phosphate nucleotidyltransferase [Fibrobacterota bacterium]